jgi:quinoprotein glucose dehydrogenase
MRCASLGLGALSLFYLAVPRAATQTEDWVEVGGSAGGSRYTHLTQITPANVGKLRLAWQYKLEPPVGGPKHPYVAFEATPLKVADTVYFCTPANAIVALDAETGQPRWKFLPPQRKWGAYHMCRGVAYHQSNSSECPERIIMGTVDAHLFAVDAKTGQACKSFGDNGSVELLTGMGQVTPAVYGITSQPTIVRGVVVVGGIVMDNGRTDNPSGVIRAFDAITGKFAWAWDMGRPDVHTEPAQGEQYTRNTPNGWAPFSADESLGLVFIPTGNSNPDNYGAKRTAAAEKYSSSVVALDAASGAVRWSFQTVHHDLWDYDVASQPVLADMPAGDGTLTPAVIQATKRGEIFVLDRRDGHPLTQVDEKPVPQGGGDGDHTTPTQPFSVGMPSLAGPVLTEEDMWGVSPIDQLYCRIKFRQARYEGPMTPPTADRPWIYSPGWMGGNDWGSVSIDEGRHVLVAVSMRMANYDRFVNKDETAKGADGTMHSVVTPIMDAPYYGVVTDYFHSPLGVPCQRPPYGMISAIDLRTRKLLWNKPLGTAKHSGPLETSLRVPFALPMGAVSMAGNLVTQTGVVFVAAALDQYFRALDEQTGKELWRTELSAAGFSTPMSYLSPKGRQLVVLSVGGNSKFGPNEGLYVQAYALP